MSDIRSFLSHFRSQRRLITLTMVLTVVSAFAEAALLVSIVPLAQSLTGSDAAGQLALGPFDLSNWSTTALLGAAALSVVVLTAMQVGNAYVAAAASSAWQHQTRDEIMRAFLATNWSLQSQERGGKLVAVSTVNVSQAAIGLSRFATGAGALAGLVVLAGTAFLISPLGAILIVLSGAVLILALRPLNGWAKRTHARLATVQVAVSTEIEEYAGFAREIRLFGVTDVVGSLLSGRFAQHERLRRTANFAASVGSPLFRMGGILMVLAIVWFASGREAASAAAFGTAALLLYRSVGYSQALQRTYQTVHEVVPFLDNIDQELAAYRQSRQTVGDVAMAQPQRLEFKNVSYAYSTGRPALRDVNAVFTRGEIVGLAGPSGAGKTTFAQLLLRLRSPDSGSVTIDGRPVGDFAEDSWSQGVALVPQEAHLLHGTVAENVAFLRPGIDLVAVVDACRRAGIHEAVEGLPEGYETPVGTAARNLSGGQIQRISIARALAGNPSILVLDEPTSALDIHSEAVIQATIESLRGEMLVVIIAHRLSTLSICDRLLFLEDGEIRDDGPPRAVLDRHPFFKLDASMGNTRTPCA